jgi:hypothetical protein
LKRWFASSDHDLDHHLQFNHRSQRKFFVDSLVKHFEIDNDDFKLTILDKTKVAIETKSFQSQASIRRTIPWLEIMLTNSVQQ